MVDPLDTSQLRGSLSEPDRLKPVTQLSQEEDDSGGHAASYLSPVKTLPDLEMGDTKDKSDKVGEISFSERFNNAFSRITVNNMYRKEEHSNLRGCVDKQHH